MKNIDNQECLNKFGEFIKKGRENRGMYQREVATLAGTSQVYISQIEQGQRNVDLTLALKICQILRLDLNEFIKQYM